MDTQQKLEVRCLEDRLISRTNPLNRAVLLSWTVWVYFAVQLRTALGCALFVAHAAVMNKLLIFISDHLIGRLIHTS
jgi:hypothetical protein